MKKTIISLLVLGSISFQCGAADLVEAPRTWRVDTGMDSSQVIVYYSGSNCASGVMRLPYSVGQDNINRFWSTVLYAKVSGKKIRIVYSDDGQCTILNFGVPNDEA